MNLSFDFKIWSNREQKHIGTVNGSIEIEDVDLPKLKEVYEYYKSIKFPICGYGNATFEEKRLHDRDCEHCNGCKPMLEWTHGENKLKDYLNKKYINPLSTLALIDISIVFKSYKIFLDNN